MKTGNNVKKVTALLAVFSLVLLLTANPAKAQGLGKTAADGDGKSKRAVQESPIATQSARSYAAEIAARKYTYAKFDMVDISESPMRLESWMVDKRYFVYRRPVDPVAKAEQTTEPKVSQEVNDAIALLLVPAEDEPLRLEAWMTDQGNFPCEKKILAPHPETGSYAKK